MEKFSMQAILLEADWAPRKDYPITPMEIRTKTASMASQVWRFPRYSNTQLSDPTPGPEEVVIRVQACGICGSDTHSLETDEQGYMIFSGPASLPVTPGHEFAGEIIEVGDRVHDLKVGDLVTAEGMLNCGQCSVCRSGHPNQCPSLKMVGFSSPGAFADYVVIDQRFCWTLNALAEFCGDAQLACELGALVEPIACSFNGIFVAAKGMRPGDHVAVFGAGPIGLGAIALVRAAGAATVIAFDTSDERCQLAIKMGADEAYNPTTLATAGSEPANEIRRLTRGWGADLLIECAGAAVQTMPQIERSYAPGGQMIYLGRTGEHAPVMLDALVSNATTIVGSRGHAGMGCFPQVIRLLERGRLDVSHMITHRRPFSSFAHAVSRSSERRDGKVMLVYP